MLSPFLADFLGNFAIKTQFPTKITTIILISVVRSSDKIGGPPKHGRENKTGDPSVDVINSLKNV